MKYVNGINYLNCLGIDNKLYKYFWIIRVLYLMLHIFIENNEPFD